MKKYTTLILAQIILCTTNLFAQKIIFKEDFNAFSGGIPGWNTSTHTGPSGWQAGEAYLATGYSVPNCLCYNASNAISNRKVAGVGDCNRLGTNYDNSNDFMYSKAIDFTGHSNVILQVASYFKQRTDGIHTEKGTIEVSIDAGNTWNVVGYAIANPNVGEFANYYFDLSVYNGYNDVRVGFRYNDGGGFLTGWAVDDILVFEPVNKDIKLVSVTPYDSLMSYHTLNTGVTHSYTVFNAGIDTIHQFTINYQQEHGTVKTDTIKNIAIPKFGTQTFTHTIPDTVKSTGKHNVTAWVQLDGDTLHWNDTTHLSISGAWFMPQKIVALEEGTATWCLDCIPGFVYMKQLTGTGYYACEVSVHDNDPMMSAQTEPYTDYLFNLDQNYSPYFLLDRRVRVDAPALIEAVNYRQQFFGYADINIDPKIEHGIFYVTANITPAVDLNGDFRAVLILTEDDVSGSTNDWDQYNGYANNMLGPMGGFENKPNPILAKDIKYQQVARGIFPSPEGETNLPANMVHNQVYSTSFQAYLDPSWNINKLRANIFLIRQSDSMVMNSNKILFYLGIKDKESSLFTNAFIYPNPSADKTTLQFNTTETGAISMQLTDISGRVLISSAPQKYEQGENKISINTAQLSPGIYIVNLISDGCRKTLKLQVIH